MKITIRTTDGSYGNDWRASYEVLIDGETVLSVGDGEPEDNNLSRNFSDILNLENIFVKIHEAGKTGEHLQIIEETL